MMRYMKVSLKEGTVYLRSFLRAMRPRQWAKNGIIYFAFIFTINERWDLSEWGESLELFGVATAAFLLFCLLSSATYLVNDLIDAPQDRLHPLKRYRPIAAGEVSPRQAKGAALAMFIVGIGLSFLLEPWFGLVVLVYLTLTLAYSMKLKQIAVVDVLVLSSGYVLRAVGGAVVIQVPISLWLYAVTSLGAMLIGFGKRRGEMAGAEGLASQQRHVLKDYSRALLNRLIVLVAGGVFIAYVAYTLTASNLPDNRTMALTVPIMAYGLYRYLHLVYHHNAGETPEEMFLKDRPLMATVFLWLTTVLVVLVLAR
jgi:4-hydroxybenzoate polyprenyltransferase